VKAGPAGAANYNGTWQKYHENALYNSQGGNKDQAPEINSFADHFLTARFPLGTCTINSTRRRNQERQNLAALIRQEYRSILDKILRETPPKIERIPP